MLGYTTFYSQRICFFRLCNNISDFLFRAKLSYSKLVKRGYIHSLLFDYFQRFCLAYKIEEKFGDKDFKLLFSRMIRYSPSVSCDINNITEINTIVKACSVKITTATKVKDTPINKKPFPTDLFELIHTPISCIPSEPFLVLNTLRRRLAQKRGRDVSITSKPLHFGDVNDVLK